MKKILILGKGGTGKELSRWLMPQYPFAGYLDDQKTDIDILAKMSEWNNFTDEYNFAGAIGNYKTVLKRSNFLKQMPLENFPALVSGKSIIYDDYESKGLVVFPGSILTSDLNIGIHVFVYHNCIVSHDTSIGNYSMLANSVTVSGGCKVGQRVYIGAGAVINEGIDIGNDSIIASGATVISNVPENTIYISKKDIRENIYLDS